MSKEAMKLALEALEYIDLVNNDHAPAIQGQRKRQENAIKALQEALAEQPAQPQREPVAVISAEQLSGMFHKLDGLDKNQWGYDWKKGWNAALRRAMDYTSPPAQRKPLTDEELFAVIKKIDRDEQYIQTSLRHLARAIEAAHGIKENT